MILLHLVTLFNKNSRDQALMLHGPLVTVARELLTVHRARRAAKAAYEPHFGVTWQSWVQDEERLRTLWMICKSLEVVVSVVFHLADSIPLSQTFAICFEHSSGRCHLGWHCPR